MMLVLSRRYGESVVLFPDEAWTGNMTVAELFREGAIEIRVIQAGAGYAKIAINAPDNIRIMRSERVVDEVNAGETGRVSEEAMEEVL